MTVYELIQELERCDPEAEVRLAHQPAWPFEYSLGQVVEVDTRGDQNEGSSLVYVGEGSQLGYLPGVATEALGW